MTEKEFFARAQEWGTRLKKLLLRSDCLHSQRTGCLAVPPLLSQGVHLESLSWDLASITHHEQRHSPHLW